MAMGVSVLIACGATWWFLKDNGLPTGEPISEAVMAEDGLAEEINPSEEQGTETQAVVESDADVTFSFAKEVARFDDGTSLEQDDLNRLFCKSTQGAVRWELSMEGAVMGAYQFDANDNGNEEFFLIDQERAIGLDPSGRPIPGFSMRPSSAITAQAVVDYDGEGNERYLLGLADGRILNHRNLGEATPGWRHVSKGNAIQAIAHLRAGRKDYICTVDESGVVMLLKRNGQRRVRTAAQLHPAQGIRPVAFEVSSDIESSLLVSRNANGEIETRRFGDGIPTPANSAEVQLLEAAEARMLSAE